MWGIYSQQTQSSTPIPQIENYVAVGYGWSTRISTSTDGETWTSVLEEASFIDVVWGGDKYVAIGGDSTCYTSSDGINWTQQTIPTAEYNKVIYTNGLYLAIGNGDSHISTSTDGITWTSRLTADEYYDVIYDVIWDGSKYIAVGSNYYGGEYANFYTSPDAITWTERTIPIGWGGYYQKIIYNGSIYVAVGVGVISTSSDGITWTLRSITASLRDAIYDGSKFIGVGEYGDCYTSIDGITWTQQTMPSGTYYKIIYNGSIYVAAGAWGDNKISTSTDGITWTSISTTGDFNDAIWDGSKFIAVGPMGSCFTSTDGITWTQQTIPYAQYSAIAYH